MTGAMLMLIGALMLCIAPATRTLGHRKAERATAVSRQLATAFPAYAPPADLEELMARTGAALDADDLARGLRDVSAAYDQAARPA